ncbi:hypothetical protein BGM09_28875 [Streptomyces sp. CBMA29]|nr:hypothetical protein [Streptomyces sp. CBMA29]
MHLVISEHDEFAALVIRTDFSNEGAWQAIVTALAQPWGYNSELESRTHIIDEPDWAGAASEAVIDALEGVDEVPVIFIADAVTMTSPHQALLAIDRSPEEDFLDPIYDREIIDSPSPRELRSTPAGVHAIHANLTLANMDFSDYAEAAAEDPTGVFHDFKDGS